MSIFGDKKLGFGLMRLEKTNGEIDLDKLCPLVDRFMSAGYNYFDTAYVLRFVGEDNFKKILARHGADKILFATDSPWSDIKGDVEIIKSFSLGKDIEEKIFCENAKKLLGI